MYVDIQATREWRAANLHKRSVTIYKAVRKGPWKQKATKLTSPCFYYKWPIGLTDSGAKVENTPQVSGEEVNRGIHAFTTAKQAVDGWGGVPLRLTASPKDLIAMDSRGGMVFTKVRVSKKAFEEALATRARYN